MKAAEVFKALSDETRLRIVNLLARRRRISVSDLVAALDMPQWHISRHLSRLRLAGLVEARRQGTWMYYSLAENVRHVVERVLNSARELLDNNVVSRDLRRLREVLRRRGQSANA